jgi:multidrug resistance protein MdtO
MEAAMVSRAMPAPRSSPFASYPGLLWRLVRGEMEPYPGRFYTAFQYTLASVLAAIVVLTFRLPHAVLGVYYPLLLMKDTTAATWKVTKICTIFLFIATLWLLLGSIFVLGSPLLHFLWVVLTLFVAAWLIEAGGDRSAATSFGLLAAGGIEILDARNSPEIRFETILYTLLSILIGIAIFVGVQYVLTTGQRIDTVQRGLVTRLRLVHDCLAQLAEGARPGKRLRKRLEQYFLIGTGHMRVVLSGLHDPPRVRDERAAAIGLIGSMVDYTHDLMADAAAALPDQQQRLAVLTVAVDKLRRDFEARRLPETLPLPPPQPKELRHSTIYRLEYAAAILSQIFSSTLTADVNVEPAEKKSEGLLRPGAFTNPEYLQFGFRVSLAAVCCYVFYWAVNWPGLAASLTTCIVTGLTSAGASRQKQMLRMLGSIGGGVLAFVAQIFVLPRVQSIDGFSIMLAVAILASTWVFTASPRIAYAGRQMALAYETVHLTDPYYNVGLTQVRDRVFGVMLGLFAMWAIYDQLWSKPASVAMTELFDETLHMVATFPAQAQPGAAESNASLRNKINQNFEQIRDAASAAVLEFRRSRRQDLAARRRIRAWQPLVRTIFMLRLSLLRYSRIGDPHVQDARVVQAVEASTRVLEEIRGMTKAATSSPEYHRVSTAEVAIPTAEADAPPAIKIAVSLATVSAYLREDVLLDVVADEGRL